MNQKTMPLADERDLAQLARTLQQNRIGLDSGKLSSRFYDIGDVGCSLLFRYLDGEFDPVELERYEDPEYAPYINIREQHLAMHPLNKAQQPPKQFTDIDLWSVSMSDAGFASLISWIGGRGGNSVGQTLKTLDLRRNLILGSAGMAYDLIQSLSASNSSQSLHTLVLSNNPLTPIFRRTLISLLPSIPSLRELGLSMTGMSSKDGKALAKYFSASPPCRLVKFDANANQLGVRGIRHIVNSLRYCYSLESVELYANSDNGTPAASDSSDNDDDSSNGDIADAASYRMLEQVRSRYLMRNIFLKSNIKDQALELLKVTRVLLSRAALKTCASSSSSEFPPACISTSTLEADTQKLNINPDHFSKLPMELKLAILRELAPNLSHHQFTSVVDYGSSRDTLPPSPVLKLPTRPLPPRGSAKNPTSPRRLGSLIRTGTTTPSAHSNSTTAIPRNDNEKQLHRWLTIVGCDMYEPTEEELNSQALTNYYNQS